MSDNRQGTEGSGARPEPADELKALKEDFERLRSDMGSLLRTLHSAGADKLGNAKERLKAAAERFESQAEAQFKEAYDTVRESGKKATNFSREQIEKRPLTSVLVAFAAGFLIGKITRRR
jgi:ElaB/YqjD/DUF883 family membrane-anchored ribosome-binding protein